MACVYIVCVHMVCTYTQSLYIFSLYIYDLHKYTGCICGLYTHDYHRYIGVYRHIHTLMYTHICRYNEYTKGETGTGLAGTGGAAGTGYYSAPYSVSGRTLYLVRAHTPYLRLLTESEIINNVWSRNLRRLAGTAD